MTNWCDSRTVPKYVSNTKRRSDNIREIMGKEGCDEDSYRRR
jgi:hypothetical protein